MLRESEMKPKFGTWQYFEEMRRQAIKHVVNTFTNEVANYTVQLWLVIDDNADKAKPWGSSVLLDINAKHYLVTAAHVLDDIDINNLAFWDEQDLVQVSGHLVYLSTQAQVNRTGDIAVWELSNDADATLMKHHQFLPLDRVRLNHHIDLRERYLLLGYPVTKTKKIFKSKTIPIESLKLFTCGVSSEAKMRNNQLDPKINFLLEYHRRKAQSFLAPKRQIEHLPAPHGLSGCGLWHMEDDKIARLVGIMTGYNYTDSIMIASRIDLATEIIRLSMDASIPASSTITVNWI